MHVQKVNVSAGVKPNSTLTKVLGFKVLTLTELFLTPTDLFSERVPAMIAFSAPFSALESFYLQFMSAEQTRCLGLCVSPMSIPTEYLVGTQRWKGERLLLESRHQTSHEECVLMVNKLAT